MTSIDSIETIPIRVPLEHLYKGSYYKMRNRCAIITIVRTSDGVVGRAYNNDSDEEQREILAIINDELAPKVVGLDLMATEKIWETMLPSTFDQLRDRRLTMQAIACIDSAVWDGVGQLLGQPLWKLWGGYRETIPMIGIGGYYGTSESDVEKDMEFFSGLHGMVGMKFKIGAKPPKDDVARLVFARKFVSDDFQFVVDANQGYTLQEALTFIRLLPDDLELRWFEEPTRWHADNNGFRDVRYKGNVRVAGGQSETSRVGMRNMIESSSIDVCNFDASWGGGPTEWRRVAALALTHDVELGHHEEGHLSAHLLASVPNGTYTEAFSPKRDPIFWHMITNRKPLVNGELLLPDAPGLGWELDEEFIERYRSDK